MYKISFTSLLKAVSYLESRQKKLTRTFLLRSFRYCRYSFPVNKIGIAVMLILPHCVVRFLLSKLIHRNG